jgi:hypothetical protein
MPRTAKKFECARSKTEDVAKKILKAMHLPTEISELHPARPPPREAADDDRLN